MRSSPCRQLLHLAAGAAALSIVCFMMSHGASSQTTRTIKIVVLFAPSGPVDTLARFAGGADWPGHKGRPCEALKRMANVNITYVPFPGDAPAVNALLGEHVTSAVVTYTAVAEQLKAGKLRALATASGV